MSAVVALLSFLKVVSFVGLLPVLTYLFLRLLVKLYWRIKRLID